MNQQSNSLAKFFVDRVAVLATMHRKEAVVAPLVQRELGLKVVVPEAFDTDRFGTFSREVKRWGTQLETARTKAANAIELTGESLAIASEGSFGPHPAMPYLPCNRELVVLIDRQHQLEIIGEALSTETNFSHTQVRTWDEAKPFAERAGFPQHGLVVIAGAATTPTGNQIRKGITDESQLREAVEWAVQTAGTAWLETDMRAHFNPTRMRVIQQATENLIQKAKSVCPECGYPGYTVVERKSGLPCGLCFQPTALIRSEVYRCQNCDFTSEIEFPNGVRSADPTYCAYCNP